MNVIRHSGNRGVLKVPNISEPPKRRPEKYTFAFRNIHIVFDFGDTNKHLYIIFNGKNTFLKKAFISFYASVLPFGNAIPNS